MPHEFLSANRSEIIARTRERVASRSAPRATQAELENGIPLFLTQLIDMLKSPGRESGTADIAESATRHGNEMRRMGFTVGQIVHDYRGLCQAITELAAETVTSITSAEFKILNGCLDDAVAFAVTEFGRQRAEVKGLRTEAQQLKELLAEVLLENRLLKKSVIGGGASDT